MKSPLMVVELDHVVLRCRQQDRTLDFYSRVLGLKEERRIGQLGLIQLRAGASMVDLVPTVTN
jgi:glyoxylase I family protein